MCDAKRETAPDIPAALITFGRSYPAGGWPLVERIFHYATEPATYGRVITNGLAFAFIISGFIGSDLLLHFRKFFSRKEAGRVPISVWDALLWLYAKTQSEITISLRDPSRKITGKLDYRSIGGQPQEILLTDPHSGGTKLGEYAYVKGSEIESIILRERCPFTFRDVLKELLWSRGSAPYTGLLVVGAVTFLIQMTRPPLLSLNAMLILQGLVFIIFFSVISALP